MRATIFILFLNLSLTSGYIQSQSIELDTPETSNDELEIAKTYKSDTSFVKSHFVSPISKFDKQRYPPVADYNTLYKRINRFKVNIDNFETAYKRINIINSSFGKYILILTFEIDNRIDTAFAYYKPALLKKYGQKTGIQIIPGSGINESGAMFFDVKNSTQKSIDDFAQKYGDVFILVKPNEDFLAIHNGLKKIDEVSFVNYLLNQGSSFSAYYIIQGLALSKYINARYEELYVWGHSQGGLAALINSLQSHPEKAIIASGFSVLMDEPYGAGHNQIIIPNYNLIHNSKAVKKEIQKMNTQFLFSWGIKETGMYGLDAKEMITQKFFLDLKNVKTYIHPRGHIYYEYAITEFLDNKL